MSKEGSRRAKLIIIILVVILGFQNKRYIYAGISGIYNFTHPKEQSHIETTKEYKKQVISQEEIELQRIREMVKDVEEAIGEFKLRHEIATVDYSFVAAPIENGGLSGKNSIQYRYYYDYDIGCDEDSLISYYDASIKKVVILLPKEKLKFYRIRENIEKTEAVEKQQTGLNKILKGKLGFGVIDHKLVEAQQKAALEYAQDQISREKEAWYDGQENKKLDEAYQVLKDKLTESLENSLKLKGIDMKDIYIQ